MPSSSDLQSKLGIPFKNPALLDQALVHSSYINENPGDTLHDNQRMEFLGDSVLNFIIADLVYREFPDFQEGKLTDIRWSLVRQDRLAEKASALGLGEHMVMGNGEDASGGRSRRNNLADTFEALVAAIYLDQGIDAARDFVRRQFAADIEAARAGQMAPNYKAILQELAQAQGKPLPLYEAVRVTGPEHDRVFFVSVSVGGKMLASGSGKTKKAAESQAAQAALEKLSAGPQA